MPETQKPGLQRLRALPAAQSSTQDLVSQIPTDNDIKAPAAKERSFMDSEVGRQVSNTAMAIPGAGGLVRAAATGGAISTGINRLAALGNTAFNLAAGEQSASEAASMVGDFAKSYGARAEVPEPTSVATGNKAAVFAASPETQAPATSSATAAEPAAPMGKVTSSGIYEHGRGQYSDSASGMGFSAGFTGQPNEQNQRAAQALAEGQSPVGMSPEEAQQKGLIGARVGYNPVYDQRLNSSAQGESASSEGGATGTKPKESWGDFTNRMIRLERGQPPGNGAGNSAAPQMSRPSAVHSGNDWNVRQRLRSLGIAASSIAGTRKERAQAQAAYQQAQLADLSAMTGQSELDSRAMVANAGLQREGMGQAGATRRTAMQEDGANTRDARRGALDATRLGMESQESTFRLRGLQRIDSAQEALDAAQSPEQSSKARARLLALHGKTEPNQWRGIATRGERRADGTEAEGGIALWNEQTGELRSNAPRQQQRAPAEGSLTVGPDGRQYEVRNGQPVLVGGGK